MSSEVGVLRPEHGFILSGLEKQVMDYLKLYENDRYLTLNRLALAVGSNETLVQRALKVLIGNNMVVEREDASIGFKAYRAVRDWESQPSEPVTPEPRVIEVQMSELKEESPEEAICPKCHSTNVIANGTRPGLNGPIPRYLCKDCGYRSSEGPGQGRPKKECPSTMSEPPREQVEKLPSELPQVKDKRRPYISQSPPFICHECSARFNKRNALISHLRITHRVKVDMDVEYAEIDKKIKEMYPEHGPKAIADAVGVNPGIIGSRITKMHKSGELTEYIHPKKAGNYPSKKAEPGVIAITPDVPEIQIQSTEKASQPFNIGQLLKVSSENKVAVVNATLEVIDEDGCEYEVAINRTNKGLILTNKLLKQLIDTLEYRIEEIHDVAEDAQRDDRDWFQNLMDEQYACEQIIEKLRKEGRIPEEKVK